MTRVNRRRFLKAASSSVGALALGAGREAEGALNPSRAADAGQASAANANAEIVVVGAGAFGGWTALYLREMGFTVTLIDQHPELTNVWLVGGGSGHGYKHGIMLGDYVANRVVGKDQNPELAATFTLKDRGF